MIDPTGRTIPAPMLPAAEPQLFVADIKAFCEYYVSKLGFAVAFTYGEPPFYGQGDARRRAAQSPVRRRAGVRGRHPRARAFAVGVDFHQTLKQEPWGARTFIVRNPDGNLLLFAGPAA